MAANLEAATGRSADDWCGVVAAAGIDGFTTIVDWLKHHHGLGHFQARLVAEEYRDRRS